MAALPYMKMYWADYDADTAHLTAMQHGIYLLLIKNYWQRGAPLPDDELRLSRIAKVSLKDWRRNEPVIREFFTVGESLWRHNRIAQELSRVEAKSLKAKEAALANAKRTQSKRSSNAERTPIYTDTDTDTEKNNKPPKGGYAFEGRVIKLKRRDFDLWQKSYPDLDLSARLQSRDDWLAHEATARDRERWFMSTSNWLANQQQKAASEVRQPAWDGMP